MGDFLFNEDKMKPIRWRCRRSVTILHSSRSYNIILLMLFTPRLSSRSDDVLDVPIKSLLF